MNQIEKFDDPEETLRQAIAAQILDVMTCMPGTVVSFDGNTCTVQGSFTTRVQQSDGTYKWIAANPLIHCPILFPGGGGWTATFPIQLGDECVVYFASRSIDEWLLMGGIQQRADLRSHSISDGFVFVGPRSAPRALQTVSTTGVEIRSDDGTTKLAVEPGLIEVTAIQGVVVHGPIMATMLKTSQMPAPSITASDSSIPIILAGGVVKYLRLSSAP